MRTHSGPAFLVFGLAASAASLTFAYVAGYLCLCERFGTQTFEQISQPGFRVVSTGQPFLDRMYPNEWLTRAFEPAARLESWLTGVNVTALNRANVDFDFQIDDNSAPQVELDGPAELRKVLERHNQLSPQLNAVNLPVKLRTAR